MTSFKFAGSAEITGEGIKKHFNRFEPWQAIFELVWNGFDARASSVKIAVVDNEMGGVASISIHDDGDGVDFKNTKENFEKFNDSSKKDNLEQHGSHGRGRLAFHRICNSAIWYTKSKDGDARIEVSAFDIKNFSGRSLDQGEQHLLLSNAEKGTCVELSDFTANLPLEDALAEKLSVEFGWYLALNEVKSLFLNGREIVVPSHEVQTCSLNIGGSNFDVKVLRWDSKPSSEKSYNYLLNSSDRIVHKEFSSFNKKPNFFVSAYVSSSWADEFEPVDSDLISSHGLTLNSPVWRELTSMVAQFTQSVYDNFLRSFVDNQLARFEEEGVFPEYPNERKEYADWKKNNTKALVRSIYLADPSVFSNLKKKQRKIIVRLLDKLAVSSENDSLLDVLDGVMNLDSESLATFASQLQKTKFEHIISTIEILQKRELAVRKLKEIMDNHYKVVLETPDLQRIIENNTWLFGQAYEILGAEEDGFNKIAKKLRNSIRDINLVEHGDCEEIAAIDGANRQVDLFLARKFLCLDSSGSKFYKCVIIEIKRPGVSLNKKHLRQLEDYADIISRYPEFSSDHMKFELILVGRKISDSDYTIGSRLASLKELGEPGLVANDGKIKSYVKNWFTIFDEFFLSNDYLLGNLKTQRESLTSFSTQELVSSLQVQEPRAEQAL